MTQTLTHTHKMSFIFLPIYNTPSPQPPTQPPEIGVKCILPPLAPPPHTHIHSENTKLQLSSYSCYNNDDNNKPIVF